MNDEKFPDEVEQHMDDLDEFGEIILKVKKYAESLIREDARLKNMVKIHYSSEGGREKLTAILRIEMNSEEKV